MQKKEKPRYYLHSIAFFSLILLIFISYYLELVFRASVVQASSQLFSPVQIANALLEDAEEAIKTEDSNKAVTHLNLANQELLNSTDSSSIQMAQIFIIDAIDAIEATDFDRALTRINLAKQQLVSATSSSGNKSLLDALPKNPWELVLYIGVSGSIIGGSYELFRNYMMRKRGKGEYGWQEIRTYS